MACEKTTDEALKASIDSLWPDDPVHPRDNCYTKLLVDLRPLAEDTILETTVARLQLHECLSSGHSSHKQWRPPKGS
jgi:hypothetical protein